MANRWSNRGFFGHGLHGNCEMEPEREYGRRFRTDMHTAERAGRPFEEGDSSAMKAS